MNDIRQILAIARRRLETTRFLGRLHAVLVVLAGLGLVLAVADRLPPDAFVPWLWVAPACAVLAMAAAIVLWSRRRPTELQVALAVDDRLELREKLSTALACRDRQDPFARAAVEDGVNTARDARTRENVARRFSVAAPRQWWISPLVIAVTVGVLALPQSRLFASDDDARSPAEEEVRVEVRENMAKLMQAADENPLLKDELADALEGLNAKPDPDSPNAQPDTRRDAIKKLTNLNRKLRDVMEGEKGKTSKALEQMLAKLKTPDGEGRGKELAEALAKGDFAEAKNVLENMLKELENGKLDAAQKEQLEEQMKDIAKQLEQLAQQQQQLQQALKQAGLNPQLANNPQALQQAIQQAQNLNQQQKQQLQQMMQAQQAAQQMCQGMGAACQSMAQAMAQGQQGQMGQGGQMAMDQLSQMEAMQQMLQQAQAMANQAQSMCQGLGQGMLGQPGNGGMGNWGQGRGGEAPIAPTPFKTKMQKADTPLGEGEIVARMLVQGIPVTGESRAKLRQVAENIPPEGYDEAQTEDPLPRQYHESLKHYFGELGEQVKAKLAEAAAPVEAGDEGATSEPSGDGGE